MKTLTVRLPEALAAEIAVEARERRVSKSDVVRERLQDVKPKHRPSSLEAIADLIGSVKDDDLPADLSTRKKHYLRQMGYGRDHRR
jgi:Arc/MetJ-type ribon-helix-helix transcriptional regulator